MKIYTKTGDTGDTSLLGGKRVKKSDPRIEAYGNVDELNAYVGLLKDLDPNNDRKKTLGIFQEDLFTIGSHLACPTDQKKTFNLPSLEESSIHNIEQLIDAFSADLPIMKNFILPGGNQHVSFCHIARCVCRRAERGVVELNELEKVDEIIIRYLNRLSDFLFILARKVAQEYQLVEYTWKGKK